MFAWMKVPCQVILLQLSCWMKRQSRIGVSEPSKMFLQNFKDYVSKDIKSDAYFLHFFKNILHIALVLFPLFGWQFLTLLIDNLSVQEMKMRLSSLFKFSLKLAGISNVLEVLESSFKGTISAQLHDLHHLQESILKSKQVQIFKYLLVIC